MECSSSQTLSLHLHLLSPNPLSTTFKNCTLFRPVNGYPLFKFKAAAQSQHVFVQAPPSTKPSPFEEKDAFPSSLPLHTKNPHAIYKDIQRFARENKLKEALTILDYVDRQGIPVNPTTFSALIAACVRTKSLIEGRQIHTHIRINELENNEFLRTKLVQMYTACGCLQDAQKLFVESSTKNPYPWNALLRGTVIAGKKQYHDVLLTYTEMREQGVELNVYSFSNIIKSFAGASALGQGSKAHGLLIKNGLIDSSILRTTLIDMYFKCGKIKLARLMFEETTDRDIVVWGAIISGFSHNRLHREALEYARMMIEKGVRPNSVILSIILPVIGEVQARRLGQEVHGYVVKASGYSKQVFVQSALIDMYSKCSDIGSGRRVFYGSMQRSAISWTALLSGYALNGRPDQAIRSIVWMQQEGFKPDIVTIATVLPICAELRALDRGKEIHAYALKNGLLPNVSIVSSLMVMYSKCGKLDYSLKLFDKMEQRNVILWTAMIDCYIENGHLNEAISVVRSMQLSKHRPDTVAMARILKVCNELKLLKLGKEIHGQVLKKNFGSVHFVSAEVVKMYGSCGAVDLARAVFDAIEVKGSMTWTAIIEVYGENDQFRYAIDLFDRISSGSITPNQFTFKAVLSICHEAGYVDDSLRIFDLMIHKYKIRPSEEHFSLIIALLTRYGQLDEARRFIQMSSSLS